MKADPQWAATYEQLQLDPQLLLKTYHMPASQLKKNWDTYEELLANGLPPDLPEAWRCFPGVYVGQVVAKIQRRASAPLQELAQSLMNLTVAYLNFDGNILIWGDFQRHQDLLARLLRGRDGKAELPYQVEMGLSQIMLAVLSHTRDEVSTFWIVTSLIDNYELRQFYQRGLPGITVYGEVLDSLVGLKLP